MASYYSQYIILNKSIKIKFSCCMLRLKHFFSMTKQQIGEYLKIVGNMSSKEMENEARLLGLPINLKEKKMTKAKLYEQLAKNIGDRQEKALKRLETLSGVKGEMNVQQKFNTTGQTYMSHIRPYFTAQYKKDEIDHLRNYEMSKIINIFPQIFVDSSSALFPEQYSRQMLQVFVKGGTHNDIKRQLKRFFQRSSLSMISNRALSPILNIKPNQSKQVALEVMQMDKEVRSMLINSRSCISKSRNSISLFLRFLRNFPNQAKFLINFYSIVSLQKLIDVQFRRTQKPDFNSVRTNINTFIILNSKLIRHQDPQIDNILLTMFRQLIRKLEDLKRPSDNTSMMNWTDLLYEVNEQLSIYAQYRDDIDNIIEQYTSNLQQLHLQPTFLRKMQPTDVIRICLRTVSLISKSKISSRLAHKLVSRLFSWHVQDIPSEYLVDLLTFLDHNNIQLQLEQAAKLTKNKALYSLGLHGTWLAIKVLSAVGWQFLHSITILSIRITELSNNLRHMVGDDLYQELLHDVDTLIHDLHGQMLRGQTTQKSQQKSQPIPFPVNKRVQDNQEYSVGNSGVILEDFM